jgi:hypothetical protein
LFFIVVAPLLIIDALADRGREVFALYAFAMSTAIGTNVQGWHEGTRASAASAVKLVASLKNSPAPPTL